MQKRRRRRTNRLKELRISAKLTQKKLAECLKIGQSAVAMWESGEHLPKSDKLPEIAKILHCRIDDLFEAESKE